MSAQDNFGASAGATAGAAAGAEAGAAAASSTRGANDSYQVRDRRCAVNFE